MTKALDTHATEVDQKINRVTNLTDKITDNKKLLEDVEAEYKNAVIEDSSKIDELFYQTESLQDEIRADEFKLKTLQSITNEHLKKHAVTTLKGFNTDVRSDYTSKFTKVNDEIRQAKRVYIQSVLLLNNELNAINKEFESTARSYSNVMDSHDVTKQDIGNSLYTELDNASYGVIKKAQSENTTIQITDFKEME